MSERMRIRRPCTRTWDSLQGEGSRRFCIDCDKFVYDLDALSAEEISSLMRTTGGICGTYLATTPADAYVPRPSVVLRRSAAPLVAAVVASALVACSDPPGVPSIPPAGVAAEAPPACANGPGGGNGTPLDPATRERLRFLGDVGYIDQK